MKPWFQAYGGEAVDIIDPDPAQIHLRDIAVSLSRINRYNGHSRFPYSVAQHSLLCLHMAATDGRSAQDQLHVLLHDAAEYAIGDITTPVKEALRYVMRGRNLQFDPLRMIEEPLMKAVYTAAGITEKAPKDLVRDYDLRALAAEKEWFMALCERPWLPLPEPRVTGLQPANLQALRPATAVRRYESLCCHLLREAGFTPLSTF